jgi:hypothetical protein
MDSLQAEVVLRVRPREVLTMSSRVRPDESTETHLLDATLVVPPR